MEFLDIFFPVLSIKVVYCDFGNWIKTKNINGNASWMRARIVKCFDATYLTKGVSGYSRIELVVGEVFLTTQ